MINCKAAKIIKNNEKKGGININHITRITRLINRMDFEAGSKSGVSGRHQSRRSATVFALTCRESNWEGENQCPGLECRQRGGFY